MPRIRYLMRAFPKPFGGPAQTRRHVQMLAESGFDAELLIDSHDDAGFYEVSPPTTLYRDYRIQPGDICVVPEGWRDHYLQLMNTAARRICFCQNHYYVNRTFADGESFAGFGVNTVLCCSQQVATHVERLYGVPEVRVIPCAVSPPSDAASKALAISYMPRKMPQDAALIRDLFRRKYPEDAVVPWDALDGLSHAEAVARIGRSAVFLSLSHREGLGLPPLEAMVAGTLVVGFHGGGGLEYATARNGAWVDEGDLEGCADTLHHTLRAYRDGRRWIADRIHEGRLTAARFSLERSRDALVRVWTDLNVEGAAESA